MTLKQLAREVKDIVKDGIATLFVWKKGRSWYYEIFYYDNENISEEGYEKYKKLNDTIKAIDENYLALNTYEYFANSTLDYIAFQVKRLYEKEEPEADITEEKISKEIDESVDVEIKLSDEEAMFLSTLALNHYENSPENLGTRKPIFLVQTQEKRVVNSDIEEPDEVKFVVNDWYDDNKFDSLEEIVRAYYKDKKCPIEIVSFDKAYGSASFTDIEGERVWLFDRSDYLKAYGIELDISEVGYCYEYKTVAYFLIKEEAERYREYQSHNLNNPRIYAVGSGYHNQGEYDCFYNLLMKLGKLINSEEH